MTISPTHIFPDAVQNKLKEQAQCPKGQIGAKHRNLLTGRLFDEPGNRYTPVYTSHKNKQKYRYYLNKELSKDKSHPRFKRARFPAHEIEKVVEGALENSGLFKPLIDEVNQRFGLIEGVGIYDKHRGCFISDQQFRQLYSNRHVELSGG